MIMSQACYKWSDNTTATGEQKQVNDIAAARKQKMFTEHKAA